MIHMAAASSPLSSWDEVLRQNIIATYNVFEEARHAHVSKVVLAVLIIPSMHLLWARHSGVKIYHCVKKHGLIKLSDPPAPDSLYGVSKLFGEIWDGIIPGFSVSRLFLYVSVLQNVKR